MLFFFLSFFSLIIHNMTSNHSIAFRNDFCCCCC
jgi:hypothetical protein